MSIPTNNFPASPGRRTLLSPWRNLSLVLGVAAFAMFAACGLTFGPAEFGRWQLARAIRLRQQGDNEAAYERLSEAMRHFTDSPELILQRAEWRLEDGDKADALADADKLLELVGDNYRWLSVHAQFLQDAGEFAKAAEDWKKIDQISRRTGNPSRENALNGLAYAQSLGKGDLEDALATANKALDLDPSSPAILDTRGYILHLLGRDSEAIDDMNRAVKGMDNVVAAAQQKPDKSRPVAEKKEEIVTQPKAIREAFPSTRADQQTAAFRAAAVIHYHRALVFKALGREAGAEADLEIARQLIGHEPDETLF